MKPLNHLFLAGYLAVIMAGCASAPSRFYTLNATAKADGAPAATCSVIVGPVFIPASVDRPQFVVTTAPNRVEVDEFNRWAAPLGDSIARVVSANLCVLLGTPQVASAPMPDFGPAWRVAIHVEQFESVRGAGKQNGEVLLDALWTVRDSSGQGLYSGHTTAREPAQGDGFAVLAAAHSRALAKLSGDIAGAIRLATSEKK
jgi:uncharacterized protein